MRAPGRPPNLLWIMTDQQREDARSRHGGLPRTPHLDRLAQSGADLRQHFAQSPVCVPSRCTLFTGRYPQAHRCRENDSRLAAHEVHLLKLLRSHGYRIGYFGKNHLLPDGELAANCQVHDAADATGATPGALHYLEFHREAHRRLRSVGVHASALYHDFPDGDTTTGRIGGAASEFVGRADPGPPWCAVVSFADPHAPHLAPRRFHALHPDDGFVLPPAPLPDGNLHPRREIKRQAQGAEAASDSDRRRYLSCYASMCSFVDEQVGRILAALHARPDAADTLVVFTSDHGDFNWHHGMGKKDLVLCDDLLHVPCLLSWPGRILPSVVDQTITEHADLLPTVLELLGQSAPDRCLQGRSFVPLLRGRDPVHRSSTVSTVCHPHQINPYRDYASFRADWERHHAESGHLLSFTAPYNVPGTFCRSLRTADWRYVWYADGFEELFDLHSDPHETRNRASAPGLAETLTSLRERCFDAHAKLEDPRSPADDLRLAAAFPDWQT